MAENADQWWESQDRARRNWYAAQDCTVESHCEEYEQEFDCERYEREQDCARYEREKTCDEWFFVLAWFCNAWVWVETSTCAAWEWVTTSVCESGRWVSTGVCEVGAWVEETVCRAWVPVANGAWQAGAWLVWAGKKGLEIFFPPPPEPKVDLTMLPPFPPGFLWGAATGGLQVEGCIETCDWSKFSTDDAIRDRVRELSLQVSTKPFNLQPIQGAVHHRDLEVLKQDLDRAVLLGLNAYRFSVEWARIQPEDGDSQDDDALQYYSDAVDAMLERNLKPLVTLNHMTLPKWVLTPPSSSLEIPGLPPMASEDDDFRDSLGGWARRATVDAYVDYVKIVVEKLMDRVDTWVTLNEPVASMIGVGYIGGVWSPGFSLAGMRARDAYDNLLRAHVAAFRAIKKLYGKDDSRVGVVHALLHSRISSEADRFLATMSWGVVAGALFGALIGGLLGFVPSLIAGGIFTNIATILIGAGLGAVVGLLVGAAWGVFADPHEEALKQWDYFFHQHFLDTIVKGRLDDRIDYRRRGSFELPRANNFFDIDDDEDWTPQVDFIGFNYYRRASIHYEPILHVAVSETGGGVFNNDMRYAKDSNPVLPYSKEKHALLNDLGWEISPEGFHVLLKRLTDDYSLPILVAENGTPEELDRNRAPYIIAHLQQMRRAMVDGADILGYCHWSLIDNYEWASGYDANARFGLFEIDRDSPKDDRLTDCEDPAPGLSFDRHITEGALAYQYFIANNPISNTPFIETLRRFGVFAPDASQVETPTLQAGAIWQCTGYNFPFRLYLSRLADGTYFGMVFEQDINRWVRLREVLVTEREDRTVSLLLTHDSLTGSGRLVTHTADVVLREDDGTYHTMTGTRFEGAFTMEWTGSRVEEVGYWQQADNSSRALTDLMINCWEGTDFDRFRVKYKMNTSNWEPNQAEANWGADIYEVTAINSVENDDNRLDGEEAVVTLSGVSLTRTGDSLAGTFTDTDGNTSTWEANRVEQDILF